jgi:hypothetical protein
MLDECAMHLRSGMRQLRVPVIQKNDPQRDPQRQQSYWLQLVKQFQ